MPFCTELLVIHGQNNYPIELRKNYLALLQLSYNKLYGLWNLEVQLCILKGSPIIPILSRINPIPQIDTYLFKVHSNIVLPSIWKHSYLPPFWLHAIWPYQSSRFNHSDY